MTVMTRDDLLGEPTGPMLPRDEAGARGRVAVTLVPKGTFVTYRRNPAKMSDLFAGPNAYNTGRVKVLTPDHAERDFPADGGTVYDDQLEPKMSYRTRAEAYKFEPYGSAKPVIGKPMWPAKQLFPLTPSVREVDQVEHDIVPTSSRTSRRDNVAVPVDGDDSKRGFGPAQEMKGDLAMLYGMGDEAFHYGEPDPDSARGVDQADILTMVAWDSQTADWMLGGLGAHRGIGMAAKIATRIAKAAVALAKKGQFKSMSEAVAWIEKRAGEIRVKRMAALEKAIKVAAKEAARIAKPQIELALRKGMADYLSDDEADALGAFRWDRAGKHFVWRHLGAFEWNPSSQSFRWSSLSGGGEEYPEYADGGDTTGWTGADNDGFPYLGGLGQTPPSWDLEQNPQEAQAVTAAATAAVASQVKSGGISTTDQILGAINSAAKIAAQVYTAKIAAKAGVAPPQPGILAKAGAVILAPDQPLWKRPLFWIGAALLVGGVGFMALKGGGGRKKGGTRRRSTTKRYRRNTFPSFNRARRWKSRWA